MMKFRRSAAALLSAALFASVAGPTVAQPLGGGWGDGAGWRRGGRAMEVDYQGRGRDRGNGRRERYGAEDGGYGQGRGGRWREGGRGDGPAPPYEGGGYGTPRGDRAWRRGEVLPQGYRGATVPNPGRFHLRRAPNGYDWVGDRRNAYLMQRSTGMVLDSVPGAYDPPPAYRGRGRGRGRR